MNPHLMSQRLPDAASMISQSSRNQAHGSGPAQTLAVPTTGFTVNSQLIQAGSLASKIVKRLSPEHLRMVRKGDKEPCRQLRFFMQYSDHVAA